MQYRFSSTNSALPPTSVLPNVLPYYQPQLKKRTTGHRLGDLWNRKLSWLPSPCYTNKCVTPNAPTFTIFLSLSLSPSLSGTLSYLLTPRSRVLKKLTVSHLVKKFPPFYRNRRFISGFTSARHLSLSRARSLHFMSPHPTFWRSVLILSSYSLSLILKKNLRTL